MKQNPFSLYDFLGYFIPGSLLIYIVILINFFKKANEINLDAILKSLPSLKLEAIVLILIISYACGHILSFVSSITVEKYSVWRYGFPSRYLLNMKSPRLRDHFLTFHGTFWGVIMLVILFPTVLLDIILGNKFGFKIFYSKPIDAPLAKLALFKINRLNNILGINEKNGFTEGEYNNSDFFRIVQHYTYDNSKNHQSKFSNYIALYGFLRTMTFLMNILFWYLIVHFIIICRYDLFVLLILFFVSMIAYTFFMAFMKFYRRYTLEGFMVLIADKEIV
jgi:hypothetical protein